jgi:hypothetical protein
MDPLPSRKVATLSVPGRPLKLFTVACTVAALLIAGDCWLAHAHASDVQNTFGPEVGGVSVRVAPAKPACLSP